MSREECIKYFTHIQDEEQKWILKQLIKDSDDIIKVSRILWYGDTSEKMGFTKGYYYYCDFEWDWNYVVNNNEW